MLFSSVCMPSLNPNYGIQSPKRGPDELLAIQLDVRDNLSNRFKWDWLGESVTTKVRLWW